MGVKIRTRRNGEWWLFVTHKGKRACKRLGRIEKSAAERMRKEAEVKLLRGDLGLLIKADPTTPTLEEYAKRFLAVVEHRLKDSTHTDYEGSLRLRILPALGPKRLGEITRADVKTLALDLRAKGNSVRNVRKTISALSCLFSEAIDDRHLTENPAAALTKLFRSKEFKGTKTEATIDPLTREELAHLLATARAHSIQRRGKTVFPYRDHWPFLLLLARTGLRLGEAQALKWGDLDLNGGFLTVQRAWVKGKLTDTKNHKPRRVDLSPQLRSALAELWADRYERVAAIDAEAQAALEVAKGVALDAWVFSEGDDPPDPSNFRKAVFKPLLVAAGLREIRIHDLRHTFASQLLQAGKELLWVSRQLGHHSAAFTLDTYAHLLPRDRRDDVNCLDDDAAKCSPAATTASNANAGNPTNAQPVETPTEIEADAYDRVSNLLIG